MIDPGYAFVASISSIILLLIEDTAQAFGGAYGGKRLGTIGDIGAYLFNIFKTISIKRSWEPGIGGI